MLDHELQHVKQNMNSILRFAPNPVKEVLVLDYQLSKVGRYNIPASEITNIKLYRNREYLKLTPADKTTYGIK